MAVTYQRTKLPTGTPSDEKLFNLLDDRVKDAFDQVNQQVQAATPTGMVALLGPAGTRKNLITAGSMQAGAASGNIGALGGDLGGTLPNPNLARGTAFPASPSANQFFFRTDQNLLYFFNGVGWSPFGGQGLAAISAVVGPFSTVETSVVSFALPAGFMRAGTTFRVRYWGNCTSTVANACNFLLKLGTTGGVGDGSTATFSPTSTTSNSIFTGEMYLTILTAGASGTENAMGLQVGIPAATSLNNLDAVLFTTVNTTVANTLHLNASTGAATTTLTFHGATIELVRP